MKRALVTGANGFVGGSLVRKLIERSVEVVAVDISFANTSLPSSSLLTRVETGIDENLVEKVPHIHYDAFYHLAWRGVNGMEKSSSHIQLANIGMALRCAEACKKLGCKRLLMAGTVAEQSVQSLPHLQCASAGMMYGVAKHCCHIMLESYCKSIGLSLVWMQFSNIYGTGNRTGNLISYTLTEILNGREASFGPALQPYDFIYADDLLEAIIRLGEVEQHRDSYFIGSGTPRILRDYLLRIGKLTGREEYIKIGVRPDDGICYDFDMFDTAKLRQDIGDFVSHSFDEGVMLTYTWLKDAY
ncbi:MAG: NAD(P)-dependent oxidoreductase [Bacteroidales bacterium]|nr:NAD(P)-dependent oxidoreductase [Bacteroidales bacterium]